MKLNRTFSVICFLIASAHSFNNLRVIRDADIEVENESSTDNDVIIKNDEDYEITEKGSKEIN